MLFIILALMPDRPTMGGSIIPANLEAAMASKTKIASTALTLVCWQCGQSFHRARKARGRHPRTCSPECRRFRAAEWRRCRPKIHEFECAICGAPFSTARPRVRCCSRACGKVLQQRLTIDTKRAKSIKKAAVVVDRQPCGQLSLRLKRWRLRIQRLWQIAISVPGGSG